MAQHLKTANQKQGQHDASGDGEARLAAQIVVGNTECFTPDERASAQELLAKIPPS